MRKRKKVVVAAVFIMLLSLILERVDGLLMAHGCNCFAIISCCFGVNQMNFGSSFGINALSSGNAIPVCHVLMSFRKRASDEKMKTELISENRRTGFEPVGGFCFETVIEYGTRCCRVSFSWSNRFFQQKSQKIQLS